MTLRAYAVLILAVLFAISPAFSEFDGFDPSLYPIPQEEPPVQPAGWAFSIWGLIYAWLIVHAGYGIWRRRTDPIWDRTRPGLILSLAVGVPWLTVAGLSAIWATVMIWAMLAGALHALLKSTDAVDRWLLQPPLAIYAGWLTAASCVSVGLLLAGWGIVGPGVAAWIGVVLALVIALVVLSLLGRAPEYGLTVIWALAGVMAQNWGARWDLVGLAVLGALAILALIGLARMRGRPGYEAH